jgi:IMP cyclohydrolase
MPQAIAFNKNLAPVSAKGSKSKRTSTATPKKKVAIVPEPTVKVGTMRHKFTGNTIKVIGEKAPVREGTQRAKIFALFQDGMPLTEFLSQARPLRGGSPDIQIALDKEFIKLV